MPVNPLIFFSVPIIPSFLFATYKHGGYSDLLTTVSTAPELHLAAPTTVTILGGAADNAAVNANDTEGRTGTHFPTTALPPSNNCTDGTDVLTKENVRVGLMFASKAFMQLLANPFVGPLTNRYTNPFNNPET